MVTINDIQFTAHISTIALIFTRIFFMLMTDVITGSRLIPSKYRLALAITLTMIVFPMIQTPTAVDIFTLSGMILIFQQALIGIITAAVFQIIFQLTLLGGELIAYQSGLGFARLINPSTNMTVNMLGQFYFITALLLFMSLNGHLMVIKLLVNSFQSIPITTSNGFNFDFSALANFSAIMFVGGFSIALPTITALLISNIAFGFLARSAPQLTIFNIGFPITIIIGFAVMFITFNATLGNIQQFFEQGFSLIHQLLGVT